MTYQNFRASICKPSPLPEGIKMKNFKKWQQKVDESVNQSLVESLLYLETQYHF